ncbi:unnamed protein product [Cyprideis torosa]|uniref:Uncharacterized protein n=1 Tax=Cyprideis torosa TaxID=163714 RepID=A0A7R8ZH53_9CRUS|nr:unnamed protein product [Cyprideis torosa]CAG0881784.1 unnamed protein product [Cyprideis torosa]
MRGKTAGMWNGGWTFRSAGPCVMDSLRCRSNKGTTSPSSSSSAPRLNVVPGGMLSSISLIPIGDGLPPLARVTSDGRLALRECPLDYMFSLQGMRTVAQDEILIVLERQTEEVELPRDILLHLNEIYQAAAKGDTYGPLSHSVATGMFLGSRDHAGFLFVRPTFQCLDGGMLLPSSPFLIGILLTKWEMPWAKVFPLRLMLRLGAEFRFYPCPLFSVRNRKPVYMEVGHTIMNLLADFRNFSYTLATVPGAKIQMEDRITSLLLPRSSYNQVMKAVSSSDEHALAFAATFSREADSHLVCTQSAEDFSYQTQAINIQNKPRKVTGASFIVFNGSLKHSSGLSGKSSIVEDGLMVHIPQETMALLRSALESCSDFEIGCGTMGEMNLDDTVQIRWIQENEDLNDGVLSPVDNRSMKGVKSVAIHKGTDYLGDSKLIRWTELFLIQVTDADSSSQRDLVDVNRLSEAVARAACLALVKHLDPLMAAGKSRLGFRAIIDMENVSYECGSRGERLPSSVLNDLDTEVIPVIHRAATALESVGGVGLVLELVFHILFCGDIEDVDKPEEVVPREAGSSLHRTREMSALNTLTEAYTDSEGEEEDRRARRLSEEARRGRPESDGEDSQDRQDVFTVVDEASQSSAGSRQGTPKIKHRGDSHQGTPKSKKLPPSLVPYMDLAAAEEEDLIPEAMDISTDAEGSAAEEEIVGSNEKPQGKVSGEQQVQETNDVEDSEAAVNDLDEYGIPPEPKGPCPPALQEQVQRILDKCKHDGIDTNAVIQRSKHFRNPSIYEKLIQFQQIEEFGTNFSPDIHNPYQWGPESYYEELARAQKIEMDKREKERKERTKVEFVSGTRKSGASTGSGTAGGQSSSTGTGEEDVKRRKSKWDQPAPPQPIKVPPTIPVGGTGIVTLPTHLQSFATASIITRNPNPVALSAVGAATIVNAFGSVKKK